mmetsp:Transcript_18588/g.41871  ORF Transcript_18588/g.41871 Transcript_18588/m.41871 type:complete len:80 (+) Transcript_18588:2-241(+)
MDEAKDLTLRALALEPRHARALSLLQRLVEAEERLAAGQVDRPHSGEGPSCEPEDDSSAGWPSSHEDSEGFPGAPAVAC